MVERSGREELGVKCGNGETIAKQLFFAYDAHRIIRNRKYPYFNPFYFYCVFYFYSHYLSLLAF